MRKLLGIGFVLILWSCQDSNQLKTDETLSKKIETGFNSKTTIVDLTQLNRFDWDELIILGPYSLIENVESSLNLNLENIKENKIKMEDSMNLIIFLNKKKSVKICELSRINGDFIKLKQIIEKAKAKFVKTEKGHIKLMD